MSQTATVTEDLTGLDFALACQVVNWYILLDTQHSACGNQADYIGLVHNFRDCTTTEKLICATCLPAFAKPCSTCGAARLTALRPIRNTP